ncbi:MAG: hypothetical protein EOM50_08750 [Erysipelotrichia bacterium]|nr:hypothetical protein [Erysipelotrichia bacterium]
MRGSRKYQCSQIAKVIFQPELSKIDQKKEGRIANASTTETYGEVWIEIIDYFFNEEKIKDIQALNSTHIERYMTMKLQTGISIQRAELISSAIGKLEVGLKMLGTRFENSDKYAEYDFSIRHTILQNAKQSNILRKGSRVKHYTRAYKDPLGLIDALVNPFYKLAAKIQFESGARVSAVENIYRLKRIKPEKLVNNHLNSIPIVSESAKHVFVEQLQGVKADPYTHKESGFLLTVEKGGKPGLVRLSMKTYEELNDYLDQNGAFKINYNTYLRALEAAAVKTCQRYEASHGLRWNYAQNRIVELQESGYSFHQAEQIVSWEMKHERPSITQHYLQ